MKLTIKTNDKKVKSILENELLGQFSDGYWENSKNKLWKHLDNVVLTENENGLEGQDFMVKRAIKQMYNVENRELLKHIGARMTGFVAFADLLEEHSNNYELMIAIEYLSEIAWGTDGFEKRITSYKPVKVTTEMIPQLRERMSYRKDEKTKKALDLLEDYISKNEVVLDVNELRETLKKTNEVLRMALYFQSNKI